MVVATHRLPILELVDRIIVLDNGRIVMDGPRDAILNKHGMAQPEAAQSNVSRINTPPSNNPGRS